jgi:hypothetical protein
MRNSALVRLQSIHKLCVIVRKKNAKSNSVLLQTQDLNFASHDASTQKPSVYAPTHYYASLMQNDFERKVIR